MAMSESFRDLNFLYDLRLYLNDIEELNAYWRAFLPFSYRTRPWRHPFVPFAPFPLTITPRELRQYAQFNFPQDPLQVVRIKYGSPGFKDIFGIEGIVKQIRLFAQFLIELRGKREEQRLANAAQRIQNARDFVKLRLESARANAEIEAIEDSGFVLFVDEHTRTLAQLNDERKITDILMVDRGTRRRRQCSGLPVRLT